MGLAFPNNVPAYSDSISTFLLGHLSLLPPLGTLFMLNSYLEFLVHPCRPAFTSAWCLPCWNGRFLRSEEVILKNGSKMYGDFLRASLFLMDDLARQSPQLLWVNINKGSPELPECLQEEDLLGLILREQLAGVYWDLTIGHTQQCFPFSRSNKLHKSWF